MNLVQLWVGLTLCSRSVNNLMALNHHVAPESLGVYKKNVPNDNIDTDTVEIRMNVHTGIEI